MATLLLGTVGRVIGGPVGGLIGTVLGGTIDRGLFGGGATRAGPRLANLAVQSAAYGEPLPRLFGRMRAAGNLVWTAGIKETQQRTGGGKGGAATNAYSYSASFAVIVAARRIERVERIWADGKLLRASDGTLNFPATIRTYVGDEAQPVDPLIASAEGIGGAPAYRGAAYVVFEDLPLADYGNRIPNLTFEIVADIGPVALDAIAAEIAPPLTRTSPLPAVVGFAAAQAGAIKQVLTALGEVSDLILGDDGVTLRLGSASTPLLIAAADLGTTDREAVPAQRHDIRRADAVVPDAVWLGYSDVDRDFQNGIQAAVRRSPTVRIAQHDVTIAATAAEVKALADAALRRAIAAQATTQLTLPWRYSDVQLGDLIRIEGEAHDWRVTHRTITGAMIALDLERVAGSSLATTVADPGRALVAADAPPGPTTLHVLDLPPLPGPLPVAPLLLLAAGGASASWRRADVLVSRDGGESYAVAATVTAAAVMGTTLTELPAGATTRWDRHATVDVELLSADAGLDSVSEAAVLAGANLALVGNEIIQFASAMSLGGRRFRLTTLLRGRRGTEAAVVGHAAGDRFVLLDDRLVPLTLPAEALGASLQFKAVGPGEDPATRSPLAVTLQAIALRPLSPVALAFVSLPGGDRRISWTRRSRAGFAWSDGIDAPLAEETERYRLTVRRGELVLRETDLVAPAWIYPAADHAADGSGATAVTLDVAQVSAAVGAGPAAALALP